MSLFAKKSLGQNFLHSKAILSRIIDAGNLQKGETVLEIGPGKGSLTSALLEKEVSVIAIEKDDRMIPFLSEMFIHPIDQKTLILRHADILELEKSLHQDLGLNAGSYKLIANIPYYITGEIIERFLENEVFPSLMVIMVQKEVADRIMARDGKESILSIAVKVFGKPEYIHTVGRHNFTPPPNVDSAILKISSISHDFFKEIDSTPSQFFTIIKKGFHHKRKKLISNLQEIFPKEVLERAWQTLGLDTDIRAETLSIDTWKDLVKNLAHSIDSFPQKISK